MKLRKYRKGEKYFFQIIDKQGAINLQSEGYDTKEARDQGIEAARPQNGEIKKAETSGAEQKDGGEAYATDGKSDDYKPMGFYKKNGGDTVNGFDSFDAEGESYFSYRLDGEIYLISEGYKSVASRDNGIKSVEKNLPIDGRYQYQQHPNGKYFFNLKAGNNQEIATSKWFNSEGDMNDIAGRLRNGGQGSGIAPEDNNTNLVAANRIASIGIGARPEPLEAKPKKKRKKRTTNPKPKAEKVYLSSGNYHFNDVNYQLFRSGNGKHYFTFKNAEDKTILLNSNVRGFDSEEQGLEKIKDVLKFAPYETNYEGKMTRNGKYYFYLKNNEGENIAKSFFFETEEKMQITIGSLLGSAAELKNLSDEEGVQNPTQTIATGDIATSTSTESAKNIDEYLDCAVYRSHIEKVDPDHTDFINFQENGEYYFAWINDGDIVMRSEGYTSESAMKNGIASVIKNRSVESRFRVIEEDDRFYSILKAGNHQEIARSCPQKDRATAMYWYPSQVAQREESRLALIQATEAKAKEEEAARVKAAAEAKEEETARMKAQDAQKIAVAAALASKTSKRQDDYLDCKYYKGHQRSSQFPDFSLFEEDGEFYFAMLDKEDDVVLRSEGYKSAKGRENGMASVLKNREIEGRYSTVKKSGQYYVVLKAGNNQEIGRSCPYKEEYKAMGFLAPAAAMMAAATPLAAISDEEPVTATVQKKSTEKEDDYLHCKEYKNKKVNDKANKVALFKHKNGQYYFAMYNSDGTVKLRSEGFEHAKTRDEELSGVLKYHDDKNMYKRIEKGSYYMDVLYDKTGREIGRSCMTKIEAIVTPKPVTGTAAAVAATVAAATPVIASNKKVKPVKVVTTANTKPEPIGVSRGSDGGGFNWWWLLPLLLLPLLWFLLKGCGGETAKVAPTPVKVEAPVPVAKPEPVSAVTEAVKEVTPAVKVAAPVAAGCNCGEKDIAIFNIPNTPAKNITKLGSFPEFGNSHALSPTDFYQKLSNRYNTNPGDRAYLDYVFRSMGYRNGFSDANSNLFSNVTLNRGTKGLLGFGEFHGYSYSTLNTSEMDRRAFKIKSNNGCDVHFMKTCGNYMFFCD